MHSKAIFYFRSIHWIGKFNYCGTAQLVRKIESHCLLISAEKNLATLQKYEILYLCQFVDMCGLRLEQWVFLPWWNAKTVIISRIRLVCMVRIDYTLKRTPIGCSSDRPSISNLLTRLIAVHIMSSMRSKQINSLSDFFIRSYWKWSKKYILLEVLHLLSTTEETTRRAYDIHTHTNSYHEYLNK